MGSKNEAPYFAHSNIPRVIKRADREKYGLPAYASRKPQPIRPEDSLSLPGCESVDVERAQAAAIAQAEELTAELRRPLGDVSQKAGEMERNAPLFFGTGDNPGLF